MPNGTKVLTLSAVIEIIATAIIPVGQDSADKVIVERVAGMERDGYILTPEARREVNKHRNT